MKTVGERKFSVTTSGGVSIHYPLAGLASRGLAVTLDQIMVLLIVSVFQILPSLLMSVNKGIAFALSAIGYFVITIGYAIFFEYRSNGQTPGKHVLKLRVMDADGRRLEVSQVILRNLMRFVDSLPFLYLVGGVAALFNSRSQRLGDVAANTVVVELRGRRPVPRQALLSRRENSLRRFPLQAGKLRQLVSVREGAVLLRSLERRDLLEESARISLFRELAADILSRVPFPAEAVADLSDEQFIRNVVDLLYSDRRGI